jgi:hypothetical protein
MNKNSLIVAYFLGLKFRSTTLESISLMFLLQSIASAALAFSIMVHAVPTTFADEVMSNYLHRDTVGLAQLNAP